jgi:hypothetical protein
MSPLYGDSTLMSTLCDRVAKVFCVDQMILRMGTAEFATKAGASRAFCTT